MGYASETSNEDQKYPNKRYQIMTAEKKINHLVKLWRKVSNMCLGVVIILQQKDAVLTKIQLFGRQLIGEDNGQNKSIGDNLKPLAIIIMPDSKFKVVWNFIIMVLLLYTCTIVPFSLAYLEESVTENLPTKIFDTFTDTLFMCDIVITFISAYEVPGGLPEVSLRKIVKQYVSTWFFVDLIATMPTDLFSEQILGQSGQDSQSGTNKLARLARLPRLYRLFKILRLIKIFKIIKFGKSIKKVFKSFSLNQSRTRMIQSLAIALFCVHVVGCFWFMSARFDEFSPNTWVARRGVIDSNLNWQYSESLYWAFQVLTTVGYGDFSADTTGEYILNLVWMSFGVSFYSFVVGSVTSIIAGEARNTETLKNKLKALD